MKKRIEILGNIASGKTTLSRMLNLTKITVINEQFRLNPFLKDFYKDMDLFSFETEVSFLLQHYHQIKMEKNNQLCDFSIYLDYAYADVTLKQKREKQFFTKIFTEILTQVDPPNFVIYLKCPTDELLKRIRRRKRKNEYSISIEYLKNIEVSINKQLIKIRNYIEIDSLKYNFTEEGKDIVFLRNIVLEKINFFLFPNYEIH